MKRKILACVVACATLFLGMGYAFWTSSLQIDTTATTGELNVKFCDMAVYGQYADEDGWAIFTGIPGSTTTGGWHPTTTSNAFTPEMFFDRGDETNANGKYNIIADDAALTAYKAKIATYTKTSFGAALTSPVTVVPAGTDELYSTGTNASDGINITLNNMYPGYAQVFRTDILNIGTIAAKLSKVDCTMTGNSTADVANMIGVSMKVLRESGAAVRVLDTNDNSKYFFIDGVKFIRLSAINSLTVNSTNVDDMLYILPGDNTMDVILGIAMDPDYNGAYTTGHVGITPASTKDDATTELENASFKLKFSWDQFNAKNPYEVPGDTSMAE